MNLSKTEEKILKVISGKDLITKIELKKVLRGDGIAESNVSDVIDTVTRNLIDKKLVVMMNPLGSTCFVITQHGSRLLRG